MRTAAEILRQTIGLIPTAMLENNQRLCIEDAIRQGMKEAIEEAAMSATLITYRYDSKGNKVNPDGLGFEVENDKQYISVDKQSILTLINELK